MKPGPIIQTGVVQTERTFPTASSLFLTGESEMGRAGVPIVLRTLAHREEFLGARPTLNPLMWDSIEAAFALGVPQIVVSRRVGAGAVRATASFADSVPTATMRVTAKGEGAYGNAFRIELEEGDTGGFRIVVTNTVVPARRETSPSFASVTEAVAWGTNAARFVDVIDIGTSSNNPAYIANVALTGGTDDRANINQAAIAAAWDAIPAQVGPGYACAAGSTTDAAQAKIITHAAARNRLARLTSPDTADSADPVSKVTAARTVAGHETARVYAGWWEIRPIVGAPQRYVPGDVVASALDCRNEANGVSPAQPSAGDLGIVDHPLFLGLSQPAWSDADLELFAAGGVTPFVTLADGSTRVYDVITVANPNTDPEYLQDGTGRILMRLNALFAQAAEPFMFDQITAGRLLDLESAAGSVLAPYLADESVALATVVARDVAECRAAGRFLVDVGIDVPDAARTVQITISKEGSA